MESVLIDFARMEWTSPARGVRYKASIRDGRQMRLVEFSEGFVEEDWCTKGHAGYVLEGSFALDLDGRAERFKTGDFLFIPAGQEYRHKAVVGPGGRVLLLLFEVI